MSMSLTHDIATELDITESRTYFPIALVTKTPLVVSARYPPPDVTLVEAPQLERPMPRYPFIRHEFLIVTAATIVAVAAQLVTSESMTTMPYTRALISASMVLSLLSMLPAIVQHHHQPGDLLLSALARLVSEAPITLTLVGIMVLTIAIVVEMFKSSSGLATAMALATAIVFAGTFYSLGSRFQQRRM